MRCAPERVRRDPIPRTPRMFSEARAHWHAQVGDAAARTEVALADPSTAAPILYRRHEPLLWGWPVDLRPTDKSSRAACESILDTRGPFRCAALVCASPHERDEAVSLSSLISPTSERNIVVVNRGCGSGRLRCGLLMPGVLMPAVVIHPVSVFVLALRE